MKFDQSKTQSLWLCTWIRIACNLRYLHGLTALVCLNGLPLRLAVRRAACARKRRNRSRDSSLRNGHSALHFCQTQRAFIRKVTLLSALLCPAAQSEVLSSVAN